MPIHYKMDNSEDRKTILGYGRSKGREEAENLYPYVEKNEQAVRQIADLQIESYLKQKDPTYTDNKSETKRLFIAGFIKGYFDEIAEQDKKAELKSAATAPPPPVQSASPRNVAILQGAIVTLKRVERNGNECVYYVEVHDPGYVEGGQEIPLAFPV